MDQTLDLYLPMDRRLALARGETLPEWDKGTALFTDISGFTPLAEALVQKLGPRRGAEELTRHLNWLYAALITEIEGFGGSVISFSGDGMTCWFSNDEGLQATAAALAMQQTVARLATLATTEQGPRLAMKAGIAMGSARRLLVGDPTIQWLETLAGQTVDRMAAAQELASAGKTLVDAQTVAALGARLQTEGWHHNSRTGERFAVVGSLQGIVPSPPPSAPLAPLADTAVRPWLLPAVYKRLQAGLGELVTELRPVTALFLRFAGLDYEHDEKAGQKLDALVRRVQTLLAQYEGALIDLTIGDKGSYLYAAFGAPIAHEDDVVRAVRVAQLMLDLPAEMPFVQSVSIGISRGTMCAGSYGGRTRRTYGVLGDEVNVAARLMERAAPGEILVSGRVRAAAAEQVEWEERPPVQVKGKREVIPLYRPHRSRQSRARAEGALVGRASECATISAALQRLRSCSEGGLLIIEGEAGIGKTRLVEALREEAHSLGLPTLDGAGDAVEQSTPYHAWRGVFQALPLPADDPEYARMAPLISPLLPTPLPDNEWTSALHGQARADNTRALLVALLQRACSTEPLVLILEDAHWLDSASWMLAAAVGHLLPGTALLLVVALRPLAENAPLEYSRLRALPTVQRLSLTPLPADEVRMLLCQRLGVSQLPEAVATLIHARAEGHPFFSEELAYALRDGGLLQVVDGEARLESGLDLQAISFPDTVQGVIISRIDCLTPAQQVVIKVASVIGRVFAFRLLHDIYPIQEDRGHLSAYLGTLERLDLTPLDSPEPELAYLFKHIITQEVSYNLLLFAQRQPLHRQVAEWYERIHAANLAPHAPLLAYHWSRSEMPERAIPYLEQAGETASRQHASQEAIAFFKEALRLAESLPEPLPAHRLAHWERRLGEAYEHLGQPVEARYHLERALALFGHPVPSTSAGLLIRLLGQIGRQMLHRLWPQGFLERAAQPREAVLGAVRSAQLLGVVHTFDNRPLPLMYSSLLALNLAESVAPSPELAQAYANTCFTTFLLPRLATSYEQRARDLVAMSGEQPELVEVLLSLAYFSLAKGAWEQTISDIDQCQSLAHPLGHWRRWEEALQVGSAMAYSRGQFQQGIAYAVDALTSARRRGDIQLQGISLLNQALNQFPFAPWNETADLLGQAIDLFAGQTHSRLIEIRCRGVLALLHLYQDDLPRARQVVEEALRLTEVSGAAAGYASGNYGIIECYLALWEQAPPSPEQTSFARAARAGCTVAMRTGYLLPITQPRALRCQGRAEWLLGRSKAAWRAWHKSFAMAEHLGLPYEAALARYEMARYTTAEERQRCVSLASEAFERLGATHDVARVQALG